MQRGKQDVPSRDSMSFGGNRLVQYTETGGGSEDSVSITRVRDTDEDEKISPDKSQKDRSMHSVNMSEESEKLNTYADMDER